MGPSLLTLRASHHRRVIPTNLPPNAALTKIVIPTGLALSQKINIANILCGNLPMSKKNLSPLSGMTSRHQRRAGFLWNQSPNAVWNGHAITKVPDASDHRSRAFAFDPPCSHSNDRIQQQEDKFDNFKTKTQHELEQPKCKASETGLGSPSGLTRATYAPSLGGPSSKFSDPTFSDRRSRAFAFDPP